MIWHHISLYGIWWELGLWFSTIFPYMVMTGTRGIWFSTITRYCRCCFIVRACSLPFFYLIEPMCIVRMGSYSYIRSRSYIHMWGIEVYNMTYKVHWPLQVLLTCFRQNSSEWEAGRSFSNILHVFFLGCLEREQIRYASASSISMLQK